MAEVVLDKVSKVFRAARGREVRAVREASLTVADREFVVLVGPSGCGKSTTLRMIAGLETISSGTITIDGRVVNDVEPKERDIAMVFQNYALYPHMTVFENMAFGLRLRKRPKAEIKRRVGEAAELLGLTELLDRLPKALSGGQRQRVAVGRAIVRQPKVFLFDEPLSNLDAKMRVQMRLELARLHERLAATMIYVTHDQVEAMTMGDRIVVMHEGVIQQVAPPLELYRHPANRFVAGFIGSPPMNLLEGRLVDDAGALKFELAESGIRLPLPLSPERKTALAPYAGRALTLGLRPEALRLAEDSAPPEAVSVTVELLEPLGAETLLHARLGKHPLVARAAGAPALRPGVTVPLTIVPDAVRAFDPETGRAVAPPDSAEILAD